MYFLAHKDILFPTSKVLIGNMYIATKLVHKKRKTKNKKTRCNKI